LATHLQCAEVKNDCSYTYRAPYNFMACTDTTFSLHKQKHGKVETRVELKEKVRQEKKRKKCLNRGKEKQNKRNNEKWITKCNKNETTRRKTEM
jgi:hypothetical protein